MTARLLMPNILASKRMVPNILASKRFPNILASKLFPNILSRQFVTKKDLKPKVAWKGMIVKKPSKRKTKKYKLKTHKGAMARWMIIKDGFIRGQCGRSHLNRKNSSYKKVDKRQRVLANSTQRRMLRKLLPYYKKRYSKLNKFQ